MEFANLKAHMEGKFAKLESQIAEVYMQAVYGPNNSFESEDSVARLRERTQFFILSQMAHETCSILYKLLFPSHYSNFLTYKFSQICKKVNNAKVGKCRGFCNPKNQTLHCKNAVKFWDHLCGKFKINTDNFDMYDDLFQYLQDECTICRSIWVTLNREKLLVAAEQYFVEDSDIKLCAIQIIYIWDYLKVTEFTKEKPDEIVNN